MKKLIPTIALIICSILIVSCGNSQTDITKETPKNPVEKAQTESVQETSTSSQPKAEKTPNDANKEPKIGTIKEMVNGDLKCYVTLVDETGKEHNLGAAFDVCEKPETFVNKKVSLDYAIESVSDCQSAEPCGKTKKELLITKILILGNK
ncbi:hypothetical protein [Calothrix sp. PCC 7507]|uniref:hypothetical protein n=1 Tax=Calothrix sp. PCC 7507 TaxID=99598 RepID=UPI00029F2D75|nr:hypothetical protein [Calothrix sp. PCC 7507]AFY36410.1 hypothetical protein Cal7507_6111 [Calothrix sp. PCC 7507]